MTDTEKKNEMHNLCVLKQISLAGAKDDQILKEAIVSIPRVFRQRSWHNNIKYVIHSTANN